MADDNFNIDSMINDEFLESLSESNSDKVSPIVPEWVVDDTSHTTYKAWQVIFQLQKQKELSIENYGKVATSKTSKSLYEIKKSEVSLAVGKSAQSIFRCSGFSDSIRIFLDKTNGKLLGFHEKEQRKQRNRQRNTGIRSRTKGDISESHQKIENELKKLKAMTTKDVLDLAINQMPIDLKRKLGL